MSVRFDPKPAPAVPDDLRELLPEQGSFELQNDQPGKIHNWHRHSLDEELFVLAGDVQLFWAAEDGLQERHCSAGTWITLPAGTDHGSIAGERGAVYMIRPEGGRTAETTFLDVLDHPYPTPAPSVAS